MAVEKSNAAELVANFSQEAAHARRQWANWLGVGSAGGIVALLSFAANLPDPDHALQVLAPAIAAFVFAIICAAPALLMQAEEHANAASYYAEEHNSQQMRAAAEARLLVIAAPQAMANQANAKRNSELKRAEEYHNYAEASWTCRNRWKWLRRIFTTASALAFVAGASYPLYLIWSEIPLAKQPQMERPAIIPPAPQKSAKSVPRGGVRDESANR